MGNQRQPCISCGGTGSHHGYYMGLIEQYRCHFCGGSGYRVVYVPDPPKPRPARRSKDASTAKGSAAPGAEPTTLAPARPKMEAADLFALLAAATSFGAILWRLVRDWDFLMPWLPEWEIAWLPFAEFACALVAAGLVGWIVGGPLRPVMNLLGKILAWALVMAALLFLAGVALVLVKGGA